MPDQDLLQKNVAVAVIFDPQDGFLLWNNRRWGGYAFPMKQMGDGDAPVQSALQAVDDRDFPLSLPNAAGGFVERTTNFKRSEGTKQETYYRYHIVEIDPGRELDKTKLNPDLGFFDHTSIKDAANMTWSTQWIVESLKHQEVAVASIARIRDGQPELLLVWKSPRGYFFPAIRRRPESPAEQMAVEAVRFDTAYDGRARATCEAEVPNVHKSQRFGLGQRTYVFLICKTTFPNVNLLQPGNALEKSLTGFGAAKENAGHELGERGYWSWFTEEEAKNRPDISPDAKALLQTVIEVAQK